VTTRKATGRLDGKVALITGAARGQGEAEARRFVAEGAAVVVADVLDDEGTRVADDLGDRAVYAHLDVRSEAEWQEVTALAEATFGPVDVLVNNAGILRIVPIALSTEAQFREVIDVNLVGTFLGVKTLATRMVATGGGSIVNVSSVQGLEGAMGMAAYSASKFAIRGLTRSAALEFGPFGVRVNSVHPGGVTTPMLDIPEIDPARASETYRSLPLRRPAHPDEIAAIVLFLASDEASYCTGSEFVADGGLTAGPNYAFDLPEQE
jgi:3alpha(or 20beta)-hydroxysteroid dehydrogenase